MHLGWQWVALRPVWSLVKRARLSQKTRQVLTCTFAGQSVTLRPVWCLVKRARPSQKTRQVLTCTLAGNGHIKTCLVSGQARPP